MLSKKHYKIFNCFVILEIIVYANLIPPSHYCSKNLQCFCIVYWKLNILRYLCPLLFPRPKILVVLFRNDDQTWEVKGKKRTSEYRRKINGLKASKNWDEWKFFILKFFSRAIEISRQFCASSNSFFTEKIQPLRRSLPHVWKGQKVLSMS